MGEVVGLQPWQPWPLSRWRWWTEPVRAERLAVLRIGLAAILLLDVLLTYLPHATDFFGSDSLGAPKLTAYLFKPGKDGAWKGNWSLLRGVEDHAVLRACLWLWAAATLALLVGAATRLSAIATWVLSISFANLNPSIDNAGDTVRGILLFYLMLCPCGAVWSVDAWLGPRVGRWLGRWGSRRPRRLRGPVLVHPWPLRLLFVQMALIYCASGIHKVVGSDWPLGRSLYYVMADWTLTRWSYAQVPVPYILTRLLTWTILAWEVLFPLLMIWRPLRIAALFFGASMHLGIFVNMELGGFGPYMLCLYLPLLPWERWANRLASRGLTPPEVAPPALRSPGTNAPGLPVAEGSTEIAQGRVLNRQEVGAAHADGDAVIAGVEVDGRLVSEGGVAGGGQPEQTAERRNGPGL
jgi:hypothetical protein